ncbi:MAG: hypothetical protein H0V89_03720, partial [Deltaproteobacteria bacterium]|nr:hypothetical protein [Deltaproteobacteria bacterium]
LTARAMQMGERPRRADEVILLGTSVLLEGVSRPSDLARDLGAALAREIPVYSLSASGQTPIDYVATLDAVAPTRGMVVLTPSFVYSPAEYPDRISAPRYGFRSARMDETLRTLGAEPEEPSGVYAIDNLPFFVNRFPYILRNAVFGPPAYLPHVHLGHEPFHGAEPERIVAAMMQLYALLDANFAINARIFEDIVRRVRADGGEVVFVAGTVNPDYRETIDTPEMREYQVRFAAFCARLAVPCLDVQPDADLRPEDFNDVVHLDEMAAMERYTAALALALAPLLAERR